MTWAEAIPDAILASLYSYLLIRLATSSDPFFKKPFYTFFIATGVYSIVSVVSFLTIFQFVYKEMYGTSDIYRIAFAANTFGATGSTFGKAFIAIHRYFVMKNRDFQEKNWSSSMIFGILVAQFIFSAVLTAPVWPASFVYENDIIKGLSKDYTLVLKACSVCMYILYIICNGIFTVLTSRELIRLGYAQEACYTTLRTSHNGNSEIRSMMVYQRHMFTIATVCSISHLIKTLQQFTFAVAIYIEEYRLATTMTRVYPIINGLATYAAPICLVFFSRKVRSRLIFCCRCSKAGSVAQYSR